MKLFNRVSHRIRSQSRKRPPVRLSFDLFEERLLLAAFTVNSNADTNTGTGNTGTLRYVINQLDASEDLTNTIDFDILGPGVQTISPASPLPSITVPVVINGYTQPGAKQNSLANGDNAVLLIELSGASAPAGTSGLIISAGGGGSTITGLVINGFPASTAGGGNGILLTSNGNVIQGNFIGTNAAGTAALGNGYGVTIDSGASKNTIGGTGAGAGNVISGNSVDGIEIGSFSNFTSGNSNLVQGNKIGTNAAGTAALGNGTTGVKTGGVGVRFVDGVSNTIGGTAAGAGNLISGNVNEGIFFHGNNGASHEMVLGNWVGTNFDGVKIPNGLDGISLLQSAGNTIGGTTSGAGNVIAFNTGAGVTVDTGTGNAIRQNSIFANRQGIVLTNGGNANQPAPTLTAADSFPGTTMVEGQLSGFAASTTYTIEFFASAPGDPSTPGQAHVFLGSQTFTTNGSGAATISATLSATVPVGQVVTATATSPADNTSEFATGVIVASAFVVTNTNDSGIGSLRQAILNADREAGHTISFAIPGAGVHTIAPTSALPTITDPVIIDGYTQRGASPNTLAVGDNAILLIELNGANAGIGVTGLTIAAGSSTVRGLVINRFGGNGVAITGSGASNASNNAVLGNFIGTNAAGTAALGNTLDGISLNDASNNRIIGNVVSGNGINQDAAGINLESNDSNNIIAGNEIGTNAAGDAMLGNSLHGIFLGNGSSNNTIGGPTDNDRNVISGNGQFPVANSSTQGGVGVYIYGANTSGNVVQRNYIGTNATGIDALTNSVIGVLISQSSGNTVQGNLISGNRFVGLEIAGGAGGRPAAISSRAT